MLKKLLPLAACLALALVALGCAAPVATETPMADTGDAAIEADASTDGASAVATDLLPFEGSEFDEGCLSCHESYDAVAEKTAHYGDSNPHDSIHGRYGSCQNCHEGDKVVNEDQKCLSCHAWPREEQSMSA